MDDTVVARLIKIMNNNYQKQLTKYKEILELSKKEKQLLVDFDLDRFCRFLSIKQEKIKQVDALNDQLVSTKDELARLLGIEQFVLSELKLNFPQQKQADQLALTINKLCTILEELGNQEQENEVLLRTKIMNIHKETAHKRKNENFQKVYKLPFEDKHHTTLDKRK